MYCPNCGKENSPGQRFCRACGLSLLTISQALANELSVAQPEDGPVEMVNHEQTGRPNPLLYGSLIIMLGLIIVIFGKTILVEKLIADLGAVIALLGVGLVGLKGVLLILPQTKNLPRSRVLLEATATTKLPHPLEMGEPSSITEDATRTFEPTYSERKAE